MMDHFFIHGVCAFCGAEEERAPQICIDQSPADTDTAIVNAVKLTLIEHGYSSTELTFNQSAPIVAAAVLGDLREAKRGRQVRITSPYEDVVVTSTEHMATVSSIVESLIKYAPDSGATIRIEIAPAFTSVQDVVENGLERHLRHAGMTSSYRPFETAALIAAKLKSWKQKGTL